MLAGTEFYILDTARTYYIGKNGNYHLVETEPETQAGLMHTVPSESIYYTGGLVNNEVLKKKVLGLEENEVNEFMIQVYTVTPERFNKSFQD